MAWVKKSDAQRRLAGMFRTLATEAADGNSLISKSEQKTLPAYLRHAGDAVRDDKGKGARLTVDELVDRAMTDAMSAWAKHNPPNNGVDSKYLSLAEAKAVAADNRGLGRFTLLAREMASVRPPPTSDGPPGLKVTMSTDHPHASLESTASGWRLSSSAVSPSSLGFTPTATLSFAGKSVVLTAARNGKFVLRRPQEMMPAGYWFSVVDTEHGDPQISTFVVEKAPSNALNAGAAVPLAQKALVDHLKAGRMREGDWTIDLGKPSTWPALVADGIMQSINQFGVGPDSHVVDQGRELTIIGPGPYGLYSEVTLDKRTRDVVRAYIEID